MSQCANVLNQLLNVKIAQLLNGKNTSIFLKILQDEGKPACNAPFYQTKLLLIQYANSLCILGCFIKLINFLTAYKYLKADIIQISLNNNIL